MPTETGFGIPIWLVLFVIAGGLLFAAKISSDDPDPENQRRWSGSWTLFLLIATAMFTIAGIVDFVIWVRPS